MRTVHGCAGVARGAGAGAPVMGPAGSSQCHCVAQSVGGAGKPAPLGGTEGRGATFLGCPS